MWKYWQELSATKIMTVSIEHHVLLHNSIEYRRSDLFVTIWNLRHRLKFDDKLRELVMEIHSESVLIAFYYY